MPVLSKPYHRRLSFVNREATTKFCDACFHPLIALWHSLSDDEIIKLAEGDRFQSEVETFVNISWMLIKLDASFFSKKDDPQLHIRLGSRRKCVCDLSNTDLKKIMTQSIETGWETFRKNVGIPCPQCNLVNDVRNKFCDRCGLSLFDSQESVDNE